VQAIAVAHGAALGITARPEGGLTADLAFRAIHPAWYSRGDQADECPIQLAIGS